MCTTEFINDEFPVITCDGVGFVLRASPDFEGATRSPQLVTMQLLLKSNTAYKSLRLRVSHVFPSSTLVCLSAATRKRVNVSNCNSTSIQQISIMQQGL